MCISASPLLCIVSNQYDYVHFTLASSMCLIKLRTCCRYAHYDGEPSFSDFHPFGGWSKPAIKQYAGDKYTCEVGVDLDYY